MKYLSIASLLLALLISSCHSSSDDYNNSVTPIPTPSGIPAQGSDVSHNFTMLTPKVIADTYDGPVLLEIRFNGSSSFTLKSSWGETISLYDDGTNGDIVANDQVYSTNLDSKKILSVLKPNDVNRPYIGSVSLSGGAFLSVFGEVSTSATPKLTPERINDFMQKTPHLVNITSQGSLVSPAEAGIGSYTKAFYQHFGDDYDFIVIIYPGFNENRHHDDVKISVTGIGKSALDISSQFGSAGRLQGITVFPNTSYFDGASVGYQHEIGHQWINFLQGPFASGIPHWPVSDLANSIMGYSPGGGQGLTFPFSLVLQDANSWKLVPQTTPQVFNDLELYLMGLLPASEVGEHFVFNDQTQTLGPNTIIHGPVTRMTINDIIH